MRRDGELTYASDELGNRIPDFSHCGYRQGEFVIPDVPVQVVVEPVEGDDGKRIQAAIDYVSKLPLQGDGFRGAVRLTGGEFQVEGQLALEASGVVLQGTGGGEGGTSIVATGSDRRALIKVKGTTDRAFEERIAIQHEYLPVGTSTIPLPEAKRFSVGDTIIVERACTEEWIKQLGTTNLIGAWKPGTRTIRWDRVVTGVTENAIEIDAPITTAIGEHLGGGTVRKYKWQGRIENVGIEDLQLISAFDSNNQADEDHAWYGVRFDNVQDAWIRRVTFRHFAGGAVHVGRGAKCITVEDCVSREPVSEVGGYRRHTFFSLGQLVLFNRCWSERGNHDFAVGNCTAGPVAFVQCRADQAFGASGPVESWASGVLYDNVRIDGSDLELQNRWNSPPGTGWSAANCVLWQCRAAHVRCFRPPGANNWAIGNWATHSGDGHIESISDFVRPFSLYEGQLRARLNGAAAERVGPFLGEPRAATNPTYEEAARFVERSGEAAQTLFDLIEARMAGASQQRLDAVDAQGAVGIDEILSAQDLEAKSEAAQEFKITDGWLVADSQLVTGKRLTPSWWRGTLHPIAARFFGHNVTRFAPGRMGLGLTETPLSIANDMAANGYASYEHHYGLWYDRRRDDHLMVRRSDGEVAPPFYEQPFARSGTGKAWDGLSKYDLTKYNPWYWNRLNELATLGEQQGFVLVHQNYFQHNILEAGAHWADCPWRPANNVNDVELPEPPPYVGDKRLFMAHNFYDVSKPNLRRLHRDYIRQCLDNFAGRSNVLQMVSAEFTGPLSFVEFWLDTIIEWKQEHGQDVLVALSCTKDVQDAILEDKVRSPHVDVIDIRYWTYDRKLEPYAPAGGVNLAPRQHMRQLRPEPSSFSSIVSAVREYRLKYPDKVVLYNADLDCRSMNDGWAVLIGGGSLANVRLPAELAKKIPLMQPVQAGERQDEWVLSSDEGDSLVYFEKRETTRDLSKVIASGTYRGRWISPSNGTVSVDEILSPNDLNSVNPKTQVLWLSPQ